MREGIGRPRLSAIKIIPFLPAVKRKELTSTLTVPRGGVQLLPLYHPLTLSFLVAVLVSIAILIVLRSLPGMTSTKLEWTHPLCVPTHIYPTRMWFSYALLARIAIGGVIASPRVVAIAQFNINVEITTRRSRTGAEKTFWGWTPPLESRMELF